MDATDWSAVIAGIALVAGTIVSAASWMAARRSAAAAESMTAIERERRHRDDRPVISITCIPVMGGGSELELLLTGPQGVEAAKVERLEIQDGEPWANPVAPGATREELAVHVRGPYEFKSGLKGQTSGGRTVEPFTLTVGYPHKLLLRETSPPLNSGSRKMCGSRTSILCPCGWR
ncbi:hypothetical protein [Streptosporangium oxazolinicum]